MLVYVPVDVPTVSEAVARARALEGSGFGFRVGPRLLTRAGAPAVSALRAYGPVLADARLGGRGEEVTAAARTLASSGATDVTVGPGSGSDVLIEAAAALGARGTRLLTVPVHPEVSDADSNAVTAGQGRGRMVSRLAATLTETDVGLLGRESDLGVVVQVAPEMRVICVATDGAEALARLRDRGAAGVVLTAESAPRDREAAAELLAAAG